MTFQKLTLLQAVRVAYLVGMHALVIILVLKTDFLVRVGKTMNLIPPDEWTVPLLQRSLLQANQDALVPPGAVVLLGDSIVQEIDVQRIAANAVNFGMGGDTTRTLAARLPILHSIARSRVVVIEVGVNDLKYRPIEMIEHDYKVLLARIADRLPIIALSVLPVDEAGTAAGKRRYLRNDFIAELNRAERAACAQHTSCRFVDTWLAMQSHANYAEDGWHLSEEGSRNLAAIIALELHGS